MKIFYLVIICLVAVCTVQAQRFFYIENTRVTGGLLKNALGVASQYVTQSPMSSDYIIKSSIATGEEDNVLLLHIEMQDSVTLKTIYQSDEKYAFRAINTKSRIWAELAVRSFINRNIPEIIASAREGHLNGEMQYLKARKDKT